VPVGTINTAEVRRPGLLLHSFRHGAYFCLTACLAPHSACIWVGLSSFRRKQSENMPLVVILEQALGQEYAWIPVPPRH
jgi:hypothetical protein